MIDFVDLDYLKPLITLSIAIGTSFCGLIATTGIPGFSGREKRQLHAGRKTRRGSSFGAASLNLTFDEDEAAKASADAEVPVASDARYGLVKYFTWAIDYALMIGLMLYFNNYYSGENFTPKNALKLWYVLIPSLIGADAIKCMAFSDVLCAAKVAHCKSLASESLELFTPSGMVKTAEFMSKVLMGEGLWRSFADKADHRQGLHYHLFYWLKNAFILYAVVIYVFVHMGWFTFDPLFETSFTLKVANFRVAVPNIIIAWFQFIIISFVKDAICMDVFHQMMHRRWYDLHYVHHLPMVESCIFNMIFFDVVDIILENGSGLVLLLAMQYCFNPNVVPSINMAGFIMLAGCDVNIHSLNPYTVCFYNPILDSMLKATVSHNLHHALNIGHYTVWPMHELTGVYAYDARTSKNDDGSPAKDWATYNRVMKTNFPEGR